MNRAARHPWPASTRAAPVQWMRMQFDPLRISLFLLMIITVSRIHQHFRIIGKLRPALLLAFATALVAIAAMMAWLKRASFTPFVVYRIGLGGVLLAVVYGWAG